MTTEQRLERLRERVKGTPLEFQETESFSGQRGFCIVIRNDFPTAETLLASLAPGPVVEITARCKDCALLGRCKFSMTERYKLIPGPDCPGPPPVDENGKPLCKWHLVLLPVGEVE